MSMCFREASTECKTCPFSSSCQPLAEKQLAMLRAELGIVAKEPRKAPVAAKPASTVSPKVMELTGGLPKKVAAWVAYIDQAGIKVVEGLTKGANPFQGRRPQFLSIACHLLLKRPQGVTRDMLNQAFMHALKWQADTAQSHVTQTRQILAALGATEDVDGLMKLRTE